MAPSLPQFSAARMRSYIFRLPLFTRSVIGVILLLWVVSYQRVFDLVQWGALIPKEIGIASSRFLISFSFLFGGRGLEEMGWRIGRGRGVLLGGCRWGGGMDWFGGEREDEWL